MKLISHRRNTIQDLNVTPKKYGVEVDIRSCGEQLIIHHDPFVAGESLRRLDRFLSAWNVDTECKRRRP